MPRRAGRAEGKVPRPNGHWKKPLKAFDVRQEKAIHVGDTRAGDFVNLEAERAKRIDSRDLKPQTYEWFWVLKTAAGTPPDPLNETVHPHPPNW